MMHNMMTEKADFMQAKPAEKAAPRKAAGRCTYHMHKIHPKMLKMFGKNGKNIKLVNNV